MSNRLVGRGGVAVGLVVAVAWQACAVYDPSLLVSARLDAGATGATGAESSTPNASSCGRARWPNRPKSDDDAVVGAPRVFVTALSRLELGHDEGASSSPPTGFDLDGVCTCPAADSCRTSPGVAPRCDGRDGRDNAGGALLAALGSFGVFDAEAVTRGLEAGAFGLVVSVRDYNGAANDTRVTLAVFVSNGVETRQDAGSPAPPAFDGTDAWTLDPGSLLAGSTSLGVDCGGDARACAPLYFDDNAYVADNVLVGRLDVPLSLGGGATLGAVTLDLSGSVITARLVPRGDARALEGGQLAGRWSTSKLLASLAVLTDPLDGKASLCGDDPTYQGLKKKICAAADIASDPKKDGFDAPCDALSIAFGFRAEPAKLGTVTQGHAPAVGCADGGAASLESCF